MEYQVSSPQFDFRQHDIIQHHFTLNAEREAENLRSRNFRINHLDRQLKLLPIGSQRRGPVFCQGREKHIAPAVFFRFAVDIHRYADLGCEFRAIGGRRRAAAASPEGEFVIDASLAFALADMRAAPVIPHQQCLAAAVNLSAWLAGDYDQFRRRHGRVQRPLGGARLKIAVLQKYSSRRRRIVPRQRATAQGLYWLECDSWMYTPMAVGNAY